ncbi:hypothetical protein Slin15195_G060340 [Septoria linicola]|uniref:Uncharacterized protein n=1 Tax=Septoria linicola TaxID=215465 RepID=A0A9Q9APJ5_9PEZI|nr:hypothetical protein Slin15195_G060340 [Septoria linicola]
MGSHDTANAVQVSHNHTAGVHPLSNPISLSDARKVARERAEATIQKRWVKKSTEQRRKILVAAWAGELAPYHRPDCQAWHQEGELVEDGTTHYREAYMWPFINQENLTKPRNLLHFISARGKCSPSAFAANDLRAMHCGIVAKALIPFVLPRHIMIFRDIDDVETYGTNLSFDDLPEAESWYQQGTKLPPGEGLLVLESQERSLAFLVRCVLEILHDVEAPWSGPLQDIPPPLLSESDTSFNMWAIFTAESQYRPPAQVSFTHIESLLCAARDAAFDHLWALREDPGYFASCVDDAKEHCQEMMEDTRAQPQPLFRHGMEDVVWARAVNKVIADAHFELELLTDLHNQASALVTMKNEYAGKDYHSQDLPTPYLDALLQFQHYVHKAVDHSRVALRMAYVSSPQLRHLYCRESEDDPEALKLSYIPKLHARPNESTQYLIWLFQKLTQDNKPLYLTESRVMMDALQHSIDTDTAVNALVSSHLVSYISDLSIIAECLRQLEIYQPCANTFEYYASQSKSEIEKEYEATSKPWKRLLRALKGSEIALARHVDVSGDALDYPVEKRRTKESVEALQRAEKALDTFWYKVDEILHLNFKSLDGLAAKDILVKGQMQRTPDWIEQARGKKAVEVVDLLKPVSEIYFDLEHGMEDTRIGSDETCNVQSKQKTSNAPPVLASKDQTAPVTVPPDIEPVFKVDQRALKVFKTLFHTPSLTGIPGDIAWPDFIHALTSIGFQADKLYGSVWYFMPAKLEEDRNILFHEPHRDGKIPFRTVRRYGRRLHRIYGWHGRMFCLAEKKRR